MRVPILLALQVAMAAAQTAKVLIFSATTGFRHDSIPTATASLKAAGPAYNISFDSTDDSTQFAPTTLSNYDAVLFLMVTDISPNDILNTEQQQAFQNYLNSGGNFVAIHAASDCLHDVDFYGKEVGAYFLSHPNISQATFLNNIDPTNPIVSMIPARWTYEEEVYKFKSDPRAVGAKVILTVEETTDSDADVEGSPHPIVWYQERGAGVSQDATLAGRSFYTALGHLNSTWQDPTFMGHVMAGISWTLQANTTRAFNPAATVGNIVATVTTGGNSVISGSSASGTTSPSPSQSTTKNAADRSTSLSAGAIGAAALALLGVL